MLYICYSPSTTKIDSRKAVTKNKAIVIFGSQRQKNGKNDTRCLFHFFIFFFVLKRASDNGLKLVCSLSLLQFRSDIGTPKAL